MTRTQESEILKYIIEIKENVAGIKQHLKDINGTQKRHGKEIYENCPNKHREMEDKIDVLSKKAYFVHGIIAAFYFIITLGLSYFLRK